MLLPLRRLLARLLRRRLLRRHLAAFAPRLGEAHGGCLLAALHLLPRFSALQRAVLALVHRLLDLVLGFLAVLRSHCIPPCTRSCARSARIIDRRTTTAPTRSTRCAPCPRRRS